MTTETDNSPEERLKEACQIFRWKAVNAVMGKIQGELKNSAPAMAFPELPYKDPGKIDPDEIREFFRKNSKKFSELVIQPTVGSDTSSEALALRKLFKWTESPDSIEIMDCDLRGLISIWSPQDTHLIRTLAALPLDQLEASLQTLLDVGTGSGLIPRILRLAEYTFPITAIDPAKAGIRKLEATDLTNIDAVQIGAQDLSVHGVFGAAVSFFTHHHIVKKHEKCLEKIADSLKPGKTFVLTDFMRPDFAATEFSEDDQLPGSRHLKLEAADFGKLEPYFKPHPSGPKEKFRKLRTMVNALEDKGFLVTNAKLHRPTVVQLTAMEGGKLRFSDSN